MENRHAILAVFELSRPEPNERRYMFSFSRMTHMVRRESEGGKPRAHQCTRSADPIRNDPERQTKRKRARHERKRGQPRCAREVNKPVRLVSCSRHLSSRKRSDGKASIARAIPRSCICHGTQGRQENGLGSHMPSQRRSPTEEEANTCHTATATRTPGPVWPRDQVDLFVVGDGVMRCDLLTNFIKKELEVVVRSSNKRRFNLAEVEGAMHIRANQCQPMMAIRDELLLGRLEPDSPKLIYSGVGACDREARWVRDPETVAAREQRGGFEPVPETEDAHEDTCIHIRSAYVLVLTPRFDVFVLTEPFKPVVQLNGGHELWPGR